MKVESAGVEEEGLEVGQEEGQAEVRYRSPVLPSHSLVRKTDTCPGNISLGGQIKHRRRTTRAQLETLEDTFVRNPKPTAVERKDLGEKLDMSPRAVQVWFQNRCVFFLCPRISLLFVLAAGFD